MADKVKILLCGDAEGKFDALFKRVDTINKKSGPFDLLLCVGNFFGINNKEFGPYRIGDKKAPVATYILGPNKQDHIDLYPNDDLHNELSTNVYYLGKRGIFTDSKGLKIAYISGIASSNENGPWTYNESDISELCDIALKGNPSFKGVDILLTSQWPADIVEQKDKLDVTQQSELLSYLCMKLKPRYVISALEGIYYERAPFRCPNLSDNDMEIATRFIGLARVGNPKKDKWLYALNLTPMEKMKIAELLQKTTDETPCPFNFFDLEGKIFKSKKRKNPGHQQYFYDMNAPMDDQKKKSKQKKARIEFDQDKCWFCLASPTFDKHLVISIGEFCYLALTKGGIVEEHFMISPLTHFQSSLACTVEIQKEMAKFKKALRKFYARNENVPVFFERNYKTSHMQLQAIPIPKQAVRELQEIFMGVY
ncbi:CWF19-like protein 1 homolog [Sitophilus oryzae]|uniref:CWF19-like protein 1 homolog n=1 Tax=Sitophilus oryzae TaxID=7048 RepID=A0A6J2YT86_SITOR|nr:CWF19-like protein 1 homolog [Sitophilus oryzae]